MRNKNILLVFLPIIFLTVQAGALARNQNGRLVLNIHVGPTCPVETNPPDPNCADRQYHGVVSLIKREDGTVRKFETNNGKVHANLPVGTYLIKVGSETGYPRCQQKDIAVQARTLIYEDVSCDSGIR